jgi:hypothetical protein
MKHVKYKIDLTEWVLPSLEDAGKALMPYLQTAVEDAIGLALVSEDTTLYFPIEYASGPEDNFDGKGEDGIGGDDISDPLTVYLCLDLGADWRQPAYSVNLRDSLLGTIDDCRRDGSYSYGLGRLSASLRELADEIDAARAKGA